MSEIWRNYFEDISIVIIGGDHHNTLSVIRCFGQYNIPFQVIILVNEKKKKPKLCFSRYVKNNYKIVIETEDNLLSEIIDINQRSVLIPCSDFAEYVIDKHSDKLVGKCLFPRFMGMPKKVCLLMDKWEQVKFAVNENILVAKSWQLKGRPFSIPNDMRYPCIVKPLVSALGSKIDITIARNNEELENALVEFANKEYNELLIQEYINKEYEALAMGCICQKQEEDCETIIRKIREYPIDKGGSTAYGVTIDAQDVYSFHHNLINKLRTMGFRGLYDIEYFVCEDKIMLNEINFRHSGSGYVLINNGVPAPIICALSLMDVQLDNIQYKKRINSIEYNMCEIQDARYVKLKRLSLKEFMNDLKRTSAFSEFQKNDLRGTWGFYREVLLSKLRR